jgi:hypothetical protein
LPSLDDVKDEGKTLLLYHSLIYVRIITVPRKQLRATASRFMSPAMEDPIHDSIHQTHCSTELLHAPASPVLFSLHKKFYYKKEEEEDG